MNASVSSAKELLEALDGPETQIHISGTISGLSSITVPPGVSLAGGTLQFRGKGVRLTTDNTLTNIAIETLPHEVAIYNATDVDSAGTLKLNNVTTRGQIYLVAEQQCHTIRVEADQVHVTEADVRGRAEQPHGYGVDCLQGGFTLWNRQADPNSSFTTTLKNISLGSPEIPIRGSGVFVAGFSDREGKLIGGALTADLITTGNIETDGGIAEGTPDKISGGVFVVSGAKVQRVENHGTVTTHGQNDMVLDNWGEVDTWVANAPIKSTGPSGIGFVNFGDINSLKVTAPIITTGRGARGFNLYDGSLNEAVFKSIRTTGDGSIGVQISMPLGSLTIEEDLETTGGEGLSLVKGVQMPLKAMALSVKDGGTIDELKIGGALRTHGDDLVTFELAPTARINQASITSIEALGENSTTTVLEGHMPEGFAI